MFSGVIHLLERIWEQAFSNGSLVHFLVVYRATFSGYSPVFLGADLGQGTQRDLHWRVGHRHVTFLEEGMLHSPLERDTF